MEEGTFAGWRKEAGDAIRRGDILFELEGEKALQEIAVRKSFGGWEPAHYGSIVDLPVPAWVLRSEKE